MALQATRSDREYDKFVELSDGTTAIRTTATISGDVNVDSSTNDTQGLIGKTGGGDFDTAYSSATEIACTGFPTYHASLSDEDIVSIVVFNASGGVVETYTRDDANITVAANTIHVTGATFGATNTFVVYTNIPRGDVAHDAVDSGNPVKIGGKASSAKPTAVANGDRVDAYFDLFGRQHVYDEGGGGVSGGGLSTYVFTPVNSFGHGTSAYASGTTFTVSGHSFTPEAVALTKVDRFNSSGVFQESLSPAQNTITASTTSGVTTYTYASGTFSAGDLFVVYQSGPERTTTLANDAQRNSITNRDSDKDVADTVAAVTNGTDGTYSYYIDYETYKNCAIQSIISGGSGTVTYTFETTAQNDGTAAASCTYVDTTLALTGTASYTATNYHLFDTNLVCKYLKIKVVASTGGANDGDWTFYLIKK